MMQEIVRYFRKYYIYVSLKSVLYKKKMMKCEKNAKCVQDDKCFNTDCKEW